MVSSPLAIAARSPRMVLCMVHLRSPDKSRLVTVQWFGAGIEVDTLRRILIAVKDGRVIAVRIRLFDMDLVSPSDRVVQPRAYVIVSASQKCLFLCHVSFPCAGKLPHARQAPPCRVRETLSPCRIRSLTPAPSRAASTAPFQPQFLVRGVSSYQPPEHQAEYRTGQQPGQYQRQMTSRRGHAAAPFAFSNTSTVWGDRSRYRSAISIARSRLRISVYIRWSAGIHLDQTIIAIFACCCAMSLCLHHSIQPAAKHPSRVQAMEASKRLRLTQLLESPCAVYQPIGWIRFRYQILTS